MSNSLINPEAINVAINTPSLLIFILNGFLGFLSPCILPMIGLYTPYLIGTSSANKSKMISKIIGFGLGFIVIFCVLGIIGGFAGSVLNNIKIGSLSARRFFDILSSIVIILFGLIFLDIVPSINFLKVNFNTSKVQEGGFFSSMLFACVLVVSWVPCLTPTLGLALMLSASNSDIIHGILPLLFYAIGLCSPLIIIMLLFNKLKFLLTFFKKHNRIIRTISGIIIIVIGVIKLIK